MSDSQVGDEPGVQAAEQAVARMRRIDRINRRAKLAALAVTTVVWLVGYGAVVALGRADSMLGGRAFWGFLFLGGLAGAAVWRRLESKEDPDCDDDA